MPIIHHRHFDYNFTLDDIVDSENFVPVGAFNPHNVHPIVIHDQGTVLAICFESCLQDALDSAVNASKLDAFLVNFQDDEFARKDYACKGAQALNLDISPYCDDCVNEDTLTYLGNASEPFDLGNLDFFELCNDDWTLEYWTIEQLNAEIERMRDRVRSASDHLSAEMFELSAHFLREIIKQRAIVRSQGYGAEA